MATLSQSRICLFLLFSVNFQSSAAQSPTIIRIGTAHTVLMLAADKSGALQQLYFGNAVPAAAIPGDASGLAAYPVFGTGQEGGEVALRLTHSDGNLTTHLVYKGETRLQSDSNVIVTRIMLKDAFYPLDVMLEFRAFQKEDIIEQSVEIVHHEAGAVTLFEATSSGLAFPKAENSFLSYYSGDWADEFNFQQSKLQPGVKIVDSKLGVRVNQHSNPSFLLSLDGPLQEEAGGVVAGSLAWPGNWQLKFDMDDRHRLHAFSGINPYASSIHLSPDSIFRTPAFLFTYSAAGSGEVSRRFHRWARRYGITDGAGPREVLLNNWEATYFNFNEAKLTALIQEAGKMGFELFLLDDGWFANKYPRNNDAAGLGDWEVNAKKLPHGIGYLAQACKDNHIKFGIWIEPEMVNPKSELFEKHPDWVITAANRPLDLQRNQLILDLANPVVEAHVYGVIEKLIAENPGISYIKWDCNRYVSNPGSAYLGKDRQEELFIDYPRAVLRIAAKVRRRFPQLEMMVCSGGAGRIDYGSLPFFQEFWTSDNTDAVDRVRIQWGAGYFFPAVGMAAHVTDIPSGVAGRSESLKFRFDVAMMGKLGVDYQVSKMTEDEKKFTRQAIITYKSIRDIVQQGDLYRLVSPYAPDGSGFRGGAAAAMYVSENRKKAVVYYYQLTKSFTGNDVLLKARGLDPERQYRFTEINAGGESRVKHLEGKTFSGAFLMQQGLSFACDRDQESVVFTLTN